MKCTVLIVNSLNSELLEKIEIKDKKRRILGIYKKYNYIEYDTYFNGNFFNFDKKLTTIFKNVYILNHDEKEVYTFCTAGMYFKNGKRLYDELKELYL